MLRPPLDSLPPAFQAAKSYQVAVHPELPGLEQLLQLRHAARAGDGGFVGLPRGIYPSPYRPPPLPKSS